MAQQIDSEWEIKHQVSMQEYHKSEQKCAWFRKQIKELKETGLGGMTQKQIDEYEYFLFCEETNFQSTNLILQWLEHYKLGYEKGMSLEQYERYF